MKVGLYQQMIVIILLIIKSLHCFLNTTPN